ncbi:MAG: hypothetical protein NZM11_07570, partial [Anaerolineales bacterium]|nr:hypothetical protein [Anaerolineales bacterium]
FGMTQSRANEWIHRLLPILKQALDDLGATPERDPKKFKVREQDRPDAVDSIIDGTERRRQRPKNRPGTTVASARPIVTSMTNPLGLTRLARVAAISGGLPVGMTAAHVAARVQLRNSYPYFG